MIATTVIAHGMDMKCPKCGGSMAEKAGGPQGNHLRCLNWRDCPGRIDLDKPGPCTLEDKVKPLVYNHSRRDLIYASVLGGLLANPGYQSDSWDVADYISAAIRMTDASLERLA